MKTATLVRQIQMVRMDSEGEITNIVLSPNRSLQWPQLLPWLVILCLPSGLVAIIWFFVGVWVILPFAGVELALLTLVMVRVCYQNYREQRILLNTDKVSVSSGVHLPFNEQHFPRANCRQVVRKAPANKIELYLRCKGKDIELGEFLTNDEKETLSQSLLGLGIVKQYERGTRMIS